MDDDLADRIAITEVISLHGHLFDGGELDRLDELFVADVVYDVSDLGAEPLIGIDAIKAAAVALGDRNPLGHHVTNIVVTHLTADRATAMSKGFGVNADGTTGSATYDDELVRTGNGWRIARRVVRARRKPLG